MGILKAAISLKQKNLSDARIMAIDSSSKSIALSIFDRKGGVATLIEVAKINFPDRMEDKLASINSHLPNIFEKYGPIDNVIIEQTIYIQSPQTSRILSYIVGHIWGKSLEYCNFVTDVEIMKWKSHIGYKNVTKSEKEAWKVKHGEKEAKKIAASERKERTGKIVKEKINGIDDITDNDILDSIAIGLWALENV